MPLPSTIAIERTALARIVAGLFALLGLSAGKSTSSIAQQRIARSLYRTIVTVLRPAESAVRRLVYLMSLTIRAKPALTRPMPQNIIRTGAGKARPCFRLFDPRLRLVRKTRSEPKVARAKPRISFFGDGEIRTIDLGRPPKGARQDGEIESAQILRRLEALKSALEDLPRQARRLRRALQKRERTPRLKMQGPLRPGYPPGHRLRRRHEIDDILRRCHHLAREALPP